MQKRLFRSLESHESNNLLKSHRDLVRQKQKPQQQEWVETIDPSKLLLGNVIGRGSFAVVHKGSYHSQTVAVKVLDFGDKKTKVSMERMKNDFEKEVGIWKNLDHPNVTKMIGATMKKKLPLKIVIRFALDIAKGWYQEPKFLFKMPPKRSEGEKSNYPFFEGDGSSSDDWRDYDMAGDDYEGPSEEEGFVRKGGFCGEEDNIVIEEEEGFVGKGGFCGEEDNVEDVVVVANDLCSLMIQTSINAYFRKIESIATVLTSLGSPMNLDDVVTFAYEGLPAKYDNVSTIIAHRGPFSDLKTIQSMLTTEKMRLKSQEQDTLVDASSSSPMVLLANSDSNVRRSSSSKEKHLLSKLGCHGNTSNVPIVGQTNIATIVSSPSPIALQNSHQVPSPRYALTHGPPGFLGPPSYTAQRAMYKLPQVQQLAPHLASSFVHPTLTGYMGHPNQIDPIRCDFSSHDSVNNLSDIFKLSIYSSVVLGDEHSIPVTNSGHSILPTPFRPLHLNNILITPNIVKNLISVRQFIFDNYCTVEFDPFGFSVKDFQNHRVMFRCDSTGPLYPVTKPSPIPQVYLTSQSTWHQRLGHPGSELLRNVISNNFISCNKEKSLVLCHACQLGKHMRLPFCDHGGEFDNHAFHKLFAGNEIQFHFSCPRSSQQNGKSKRMI
nr:ribonuclease H-like domain-containing protein [Tanacetum cinerariifolium]